MDTPPHIPVRPRPLYRRNPRPAPVDVPLVETTTTPVPAPAPTIEDVAALVRAPFTVVTDESGVVHTDSTLSVRCERGHVHEHYIKHILTGGAITCTTCSVGGKFAALVRETAETLLSVPFTRAKVGEYVCRELNITLVCVRMTGDDKWAGDDNGRTITIYNTTSAKRVRDMLRRALHGYPRLTATMAARVAPPQRRKPAEKSLLPFTPALAGLTAASAPNPLLARMQMDVVGGDTSHFLCLENC
jgi:hypothetical protein